MNTFYEPLLQLEVFVKARERLAKEEGLLLLTGCVESQKTHLMYSLGKDYEVKLILTYNELKAKEIYEEYQALGEEVYYYPAKDFLFFHADLQGNELLRQRMTAVSRLLSGQPAVIVTTLDGCMDPLLPFEKLRELTLSIGCGSMVEMDAVKTRLVQMGYERTGQAELPGQFAVRGGILDIYPLTEEYPVRIELWDDEVDSIRSFDASSQRSMENLEEILLYPAAELNPGEHHCQGVSLLEYLEEYRSLVFLDEVNRLFERGETVEKEYRQNFENRLEKGQIEAGLEEEIFACEQIMYRLNRMKGAAFGTLETTDKRMDFKSRCRLDTRSIQSYNGHFELLIKDLKRWKREQYQVILMCASRTRGKRLAGELLAEDLNAFYSEEEARVVQPGEIMVVHGNVFRGYEYPLIRFAVVSETDVFGREKKKKKKKLKSYEGRKIGSFTDLSIGDYVVHENHGLGIYRGIEKITVDKTVKDYMKIEYSKGACLYILATQLDAIQKYGSADAGKVPRLNTLGGQDWKKTRSKVKGAVQEVAKDLVELYAARQSEKGYVYGPDTIWQREFEELFPYEETEDQQKAIQDVKKDMESSRIMDRLICGDVGYGKTEVAIRAAFKAVQESRQVVYLVPTTILAQQHYNTFVQRMKEFPVRTDLLCRFRTPGQQKKTLEDLRKGLVDIVIGTHRVLSKDVEYKELGLLIIDEEQRFGVADKEKIKKLKTNVDVLTLSATPIPRTLHMSLAGIRDMSVLEEPPMDRMPIQTYVCEYDEEMVRAAVHRELAREGQIYYVYNRVETIADVTHRLQELVPEASVAYAHGQMKEHELEKIMYEFIEGSIDVLVSTTIIETGMDISNVNTIIIHDADRMGLSQLYQLRGRVGRANRTAYAFLLYKKDKMLKEVAEKRLHAIREYSDLGSGFKIAMRDMEIRGVGTLLGQRQHGHMQAVGYNLYCKMLNEAVRRMKGEEKVEEEDFETVADLQIDAYIPDSYIRNEAVKLDIYRRIAAVENEEEQEDMLEELIDRFGEPPKSVLNLLEITKLRGQAHELYIKEIKGRADRIVFTMYEKAAIYPARIPELISGMGSSMIFKKSEPVQFIYEVNRRKQKAEQDLLSLTGEILNKMKILLESQEKQQNMDAGASDR
ncbi:MAG: transcription-repair coupling factor [Lachnospiraceae bacterium]|nr:transcription-repair coupling factor [Lachnospiraceae bacterium]